MRHVILALFMWSCSLSEGPRKVQDVSPLDVMYRWNNVSFVIEQEKGLVRLDARPGGEIVERYYYSITDVSQSGFFAQVTEGSVLNEGTYRATFERHPEREEYDCGLSYLFDMYLMNVTSDALLVATPTSETCY